MNKICYGCNTRCRLGMCQGRDGDFKYCFRRVGSTTDLKKTITPFNTLHELYEKQPWLDWIIPESLVLSNEPYGGFNMVLLWGMDKYEENNSPDKALPVGFVTVFDTTQMAPVEYVKENEK